jgi:hypothetical protein
MENNFKFVESGEDRAIWWRHICAFPYRASHGEIEGSIGNQGKVLRGWTTRRGEQPSLRVKCTRNEEYWRVRRRYFAISKPSERRSITGNIVIDIPVWRSDKGNAFYFETLFTTTVTKSGRSIRIWRWGEKAHKLSSHDGHVLVS